MLRTYRPDGTMNYEHNTLVGDEDLAPNLEKLLALPDVTPCTCGPCCRSASCTP